MKRLLLMLSITILMSSCATYYLVDTNFYTLQRGMTKQSFINWIESTQRPPNGRTVVGLKPANTKSFKYGSDVWEIWVYNVYSINHNAYGMAAGASYDHQEYVAFKNGLVEEWGTGTLPITIRQNPTQIDLNIKH